MPEIADIYYGMPTWTQEGGWGVVGPSTSADIVYGGAEPTGQLATYQPPPSPTPATQSIIQYINSPEQLATAGIGLTPEIVWALVAKFGPTILKTVIAMFGNMTLPAWLTAILAAVGVAGGIDVLTPGGLINLDPGPGLIDVGVTGPGVFGSSIPGMRSGEVPVKVWWTGTAKFYKTNLGRFVALKKDGTYKFFRPAHNIVIGRDPKLGTMVRAMKRMDNLAMKVNRRMGKYRRRTTSFRYRGNGRRDLTVVR